jgi:hypothetical protein
MVYLRGSRGKGQKMKKVTYIEIEYKELNKIINKHCNLPYKYDVVVAEEMNNDSVYKFFLEESEGDDVELDEYEEKYYESMKNGENKNYMTRVLMKVLIKKGILEQGKYLVSVCW